MSRWQTGGRPERRSAEGAGGGVLIIRPPDSGPRGCAPSGPGFPFRSGGLRWGSNLGFLGGLAMGIFGEIVARIRGAGTQDAPPDPTPADGVVEILAVPGFATE